MAYTLENLKLTDERRVVWAGDENDPVLVARLFLLPDGRLNLWNGFVCPAFDRANTQKIVDWNTKAAADGAECDTFEWDGDTLVSFYSGDRTQRESIEPILDDAGVLRWSVGAWSWTWMEADPADWPRDHAGGE